MFGGCENLPNPVTLFTHKMPGRSSKEVPSAFHMFSGCFLYTFGKTYSISPILPMITAEKKRRIRTLMVFAPYLAKQPKSSLMDSPLSRLGVSRVLDATIRHIEVVPHYNSFRGVSVILRKCEFSRERGRWDICEKKAHLQNNEPLIEDVTPLRFLN